MNREIEIKYLLTDKKHRDVLIGELQKVYPNSELKKTSVIISYFYKPAKSVKQILDSARAVLGDEDYEELNSVIKKASNLIVKTRSIDDTVYFVVKGAADGEDAVHAINRIEFEVIVDISLEQLNSIVVGSGIELVSKWSSKRDYYDLDKELKMDVEFVAGYGYKAELEILTNEEKVDEIVAEIRDVADKLDLTEASQELLGRMYSYYNNHWQEYFNTDKVFPNTVWKELGREA